MKRYILYILSISAALFSCDIQDNEAEPEKSFFKIYDNDEFQASYIPIDVKQAEDGGYIVLGAFRITNSEDSTDNNKSPYTGVYTLKTDRYGEFESQEDFGNDFINPVGDLMKINNKFYFLAMNPINHVSGLFSIDQTGTVEIDSAIGFTAPLHASVDGEEILMLSYDYGGKQSIFSVINANGEVSKSQGFDIGAGEGTELPIIESLTRTGKPLPYITGRMDNGVYYFNGFVNYTMSLQFTNFTETINGVVQGNTTDAAISSVINLGSDIFALSRYNAGDNYVIPRQNVDFSGTTSSHDYPGNLFPELVEDAHVVVKQISINDMDITMYASQTQNGQIVLMAFASSTGELLGTKYLGAGNRFEVANFSTTEDNGLIILGNTYLSGRFSRLCLFKLSEDDLKEIIE